MSSPRPKKIQKSLNVLGKGDDGCVVDGMHTAHSQSLVTKIMTDEKKYKQEIEVAKMLAKIDSQQHYLIYPTYNEVRKATSDIIGLCGMQGVSEGSNVYLLQMKAAGVSLGKVAKMATPYLTDAEGRKVYADIVGALQVLHAANYIHGDLYADNILILKEKRGVRAYLIDFTFTKKSTDHSKDIDDLCTRVLNVLAQCIQPTTSPSKSEESFRTILIRVVARCRKKILSGLQMLDHEVKEAASAEKQKVQKALSKELPVKKLMF